MNIAVLIKQVPVSNDVSVDPETHALVRASSEGMINPADLNAIEEAMQLKEQTDGKVVVFTMGPPDAEKALRDAMALLSELMTGLAIGILATKDGHNIDVNRLIMDIQPAVLNNSAGKALSVAETDMLRAQYLRSNLPEID